MPGGLGRGKEAVTMVNTPVYMDPGDGGDGDDDDVTGGKGEKKKKNTYRHLIKGIPGVLLFLLSWFIILFFYYLQQENTL